MKIGLAEIGRVMVRGSDAKAVCASDANVIFENLIRDLGPGNEAVIFGPSRANVIDGVCSPLSSTTLPSLRVQLACEIANTCDVLVVFIGFHGTVSLANSIPTLDGKGIVSPLETFKRTVAPVIAAVNSWQDIWGGAREPVYICNDPRSMLVARDLKWPPREPILAQWDGKHLAKHYRYGDFRTPEELGYCEVDSTSVPGHWVTVHKYRYAAIELSVVL